MGNCGWNVLYERRIFSIRRETEKKRKEKILSVNKIRINSIVHASYNSV